MSLKKRGFGGILMTPEFGVFLPVLLIAIITTLYDSVFITRRYLASLLVSVVPIGLAAVGESMVIMCSEIDLGMGSVGGFAGIMCGYAFASWGWSLFPSITLGIITGVVFGFVVGFLVTKLGITSWIITMAAQFVAQGLSATITQGNPQNIDNPALLEFTLAEPLGLNWFFFIFLGLVILFDFIVRKTRFGYELRAVGGNRESAEMAGIDVRVVKWIAFILAGLFAAFSGLSDVLLTGGGISSFGAGREFRAITCCAIGGLSMSGGAGSIYGVALGVLLFQTLVYCLRLFGIGINSQLLIIGTVLILAVVLDMQRKRINARMGS
jgi:ribose/xylose/arabinose/galactoside ABC-type transport system permease subunit